MSARAVLNAVYTRTAIRAEETDRLILLAGGNPERATHRADLDRDLGLSEDLDPGDGKTNVIELAAWVASVNNSSRGL